MNRSRHIPATRALAHALVLFAAAMLLYGPAMAQGTSDPIPGATYVGEQACVSCHQVEEQHFGHTTHARIFRQNPRNEKERQVCEACHGPGSLHVAEEEREQHADPRERREGDRPPGDKLIIGFTKQWGTPIDKQNGQCLSCHQGGQRLHWPGSMHDLNKLACSDCHNPMARFAGTGLLKKPSITETCQSCHQQQRAEFRKRSHMPVPEGKMTCTDCHNPHGSPTQPLLKADTVNDVCYSCHAEKRGPLVWEHAPVRENCANCHSPHGSNHDKLLLVARPHLCQQCHANPNHPAAFYNSTQLAGNETGLNSRVMGRSCQNCHSQIHGSNHPAGARFQR
ncbi:DmsE family decaheme c-type cytochrome [Pseudothauera rhizosphaerae]|uniref:DmsE family decaheme c-type cytochrome n=1 Tax=Pseudothauera rhizosphaerae TaxID=2565932 RepID=A0A4S4APE3_9RHOO|nr:DmsE family decaheme c-type cytochrome [Pseudothauera rhizosphaerae]THF60310.1 DmsE family decaheme c-type cytochrome [Pseudothauera rhizosphaerae]